MGKPDGRHNLFHEIFQLLIKARHGLTIVVGSSTDDTLSHCFFYDIPRQPTPDYDIPLLPLNNTTHIFLYNNNILHPIFCYVC